MRIPPSLVAMRVVEQGSTRFKIWFPLFILWPLLFVFLLLTLIVSLIVDAARLVAGRRLCYTRLVIGGLGVVGETRGVEVFVEDKHHTVAVTLR
jgi:hypothetical protein